MVTFGKARWHSADDYPGWVNASPITQSAFYLGFAMFGQNLKTARMVSVTWFALFLIAFGIAYYHCRSSPVFWVGLLMLGSQYVLWVLLARPFSKLRRCPSFTQRYCYSGGSQTLHTKRNRDNSCWRDGNVRYQARFSCYSSACTTRNSDGLGCSKSARETIPDFSCHCSRVYFFFSVICKRSAWLCHSAVHYKELVCFRP